MYVIGVDGGGTKTLAVAADSKGNVSAISEGQGSNPNFVGVAAAIQVLKRVLYEIEQSCDLNHPETEAAHVALCVPGLKRYEREVVEALGLPLDRVTISSDVLSTFYGAIGKEAGIVALAGTGSFVTATNLLRESASVGGWGPIIGDKGSGHIIAVHALRAVALHYDGMGPATTLTDKILRFYEVPTAHELKSIIHLDNISKLTYLVAEAAEEGDRCAQSIIVDAAEHLAEMAASLAERLGMNTSQYELALTGGMPRMGGRFTTSFAERLALLCPAISQVEPQLPPVGGALLLALRACGIQWTDDIVAAMKRTL